MGIPQIYGKQLYMQSRSYGPLVLGAIVWSPFKKLRAHRAFLGIHRSLMPRFMARQHGSTRVSSAFQCLGSSRGGLLYLCTRLPVTELCICGYSRTGVWGSFLGTLATAFVQAYTILAILCYIIFYHLILQHCCIIYSTTSLQECRRL